MTPQPARISNRSNRSSYRIFLTRCSFYLPHLSKARLKRQMGSYTWCTEEHLAQSCDHVCDESACWKMHTAATRRVHKHKIYKQREERLHQICTTVHTTGLTYLKRSWVLTEWQKPDLAMHSHATPWDGLLSLTWGKLFFKTKKKSHIMTKIRIIFWGLREYLSGCSYNPFERKKYGWEHSAKSRVMAYSNGTFETDLVKTP